MPRVAEPVSPGATTGNAPGRPKRFLAPGGGLSEAKARGKEGIAGKLARAFIDSKITALLMLAVFLAGVLALFSTPREYNPQIVVPAANIYVAKPGASAEEILNLVVKPLEAIMHAQPGVDHTYGVAANDVGVVTVQFKVGENTEDSLVKLHNQIIQNLDRIPPGASEPVVKSVSVDDVPIMTLTLSSDRLADTDLREVVLRFEEQLRNVDGVSFTQVVGGGARAVNVWLDPGRLAATGLDLARVDQALRGANAALPTGELVADGRVTPLRLDSFIGTAREVGEVVIGVSDGRPVHLREVARIEDGATDSEAATRIGFGPASESPGPERPAVTLTVAKKAGTNAVAVTRAVLEKLDELKARALPESVRVTVTRDDGERANAAVNLLVEHLGIAIGTVILIMVIFLGWREAGIVTLTIPLIVLVVLTVGFMADQTINRITLFALILALGLLVDDAIVVVENIHRHLHLGKIRDFRELLITATNEIGGPTNVATVAVVLAFIPMAFVSGMMGPFMRPIPFNVPVAMIASLFMAYVVVPWVAYRWLRGKAAAALAAAPSLDEPHADGHGPDDALTRGYKRVLLPLIASRGKRNLFFLAVLAMLVLAMLQPAWQFLRPSGIDGPLSPLGVELKMLPNDNTNTLLVQVDTPEGAAAATTDRVARAAGAVLAAHPHVTDYQTFLGMTAPVDFAALVRGDLVRRGENLAQIRVNLIDKHHRDASSHDIAAELNAALDAVRRAHPEAVVKLYETPPGPPVPAQLVAELYGPDYDTLRVAAAEVNAAMRGLHGAINVDDSVTADQETWRVRVDRERAALSGIAPAQVGKLLRDYLAGVSIGTVHDDDAREPVNITVRLPRTDRQTVSRLLDLTLLNAHGQAVPLAAVASMERVTLDKPILTRDQHPVVMVGGEMIASSPVYAVLALDRKLAEQPLKSGAVFRTGNLGFVEAQADDVASHHLLWGGEMRLTLDVFRDLGSAFMVALVFIYLLLVAYYKSFMLPVIVMGAIPLTVVGVFPGHWAMGQAFTATSMIGVIALAGVVVRNSLLLIDFILDYREQGASVEEAVVQAGATRLRPILLTALAIILGSAIMVTDPVFGGLAVALIFGTFASTALTLVVIPLLYLLWQRPGASTHDS
jgi:multidrug efflux pump subunit AcrB